MNEISLNIFSVFGTQCNKIILLSLGLCQKYCLSDAIYKKEFERKNQKCFSKVVFYTLRKAAKYLLNVCIERNIDHYEHLIR